MDEPKKPSYEEFKAHIDKRREEAYQLHEELNRMSDDAERFGREAVNLRADGKEQESVSALITAGNIVKSIRDKNEILIDKEAELDQLGVAQPELSKQYSDEINAKYRKVDLHKELQLPQTKENPLDKYMEEAREKVKEQDNDLER